MALILMQQFDSYNKSEVISKAQAWGLFFAKSLIHPVLLLSLSYAPSSVCYNFHNFFRKTSRHLLTRIASATVTRAQYTTFLIYGIIHLFIWKGKGPQTSLPRSCVLTHSAAATERAENSQVHFVVRSMVYSALP